MVFVVVLSTAEFFLPVIILLSIALAYGLESGALQNAVLNWFFSWIFTPSFFSVAIFLITLLVLLNVVVFEVIAEKFHIGKLSSVAYDIGCSGFMAWAPIISLLLMVLIFIIWGLNEIGLNMDGLEWLYNNSDYRWLDHLLRR